MPAPKALLGLAALAALPLGGCADTLAVLDEMMVGVAQGYAAGGYQSSQGGCYTDANGYRSPGCYDYLFEPVNGEPFIPPAQPSSSSGTPGSSSSNQSSSSDGVYCTNDPTHWRCPITGQGGPQQTGPRQTTPQ